MCTKAHALCCNESTLGLYPKKNDQGQGQRSCAKMFTISQFTVAIGKNVHVQYQENS